MSSYRSLRMSFITTCIICFSLITEFNQLEISSGDEPEFELQYESHITFWLKDATGPLDEHRMMTELPMEDRIKLCNAARKFVGVTHLDLLSPITNVPLRKSPTNSMLLECDTIPVSYLRPLQGTNRWDIVRDVNQFTRTHKFDLRIDHKKPISCAESIQNDPLYDDIGVYELREMIKSICFEDMMVKKSYMVSHFKPPHLMDLCLAAKQEIIQRKDLPVPVFQSREFKPVQKYDFKNMNRVALQCPTSPLVYIFMKHPRLNNKDVQVVLLADRKKAESSNTTSSLS